MSECISWIVSVEYRGVHMYPITYQQAATFRQSHRDVLAQFENFAYGMVCVVNAFEVLMQMLT